MDRRNDTHVPGQNEPAVIMYPPVPFCKHFISGLMWMYDGPPIDGNIKVEDNGKLVYYQDIVEPGMTHFQFPFPQGSFEVNTPLVITLSAGGPGVSGALCVLEHWTKIYNKGDCE